MREAAFSLKRYNFNRIHLNMDEVEPKGNLFLDIQPSGTFFKEKGEFELRFLFSANKEQNAKSPSIVEVSCKATFIFKDEVNSLDLIPDYFYSNSIAILFPYVRAFISTLTLQANYAPIVLPTMNLTELNAILKKHVTVE